MCIRDRRQIAAAGCRTRKDSIRMIETLFTARPEFFKGKKRADIRVFFEEALHFLEPAVSYTHLDVYKRQEDEPAPCPCCWACMMQNDTCEDAPFLDGILVRLDEAA